jgi:hypothetical protein
LDVTRPHYSTYARANTLLTDFAYYWPPRAVLELLPNFGDGRDEAAAV